ncbi:DUF4384 domain-containing protein [Massilia sp. TWR1-2-2]|uniref:DUF4384 domain-containing protein n=1 Tax=Massilia sp. TWR1-2-2 TaxID=2804584 RepID=UPI003CE6FF1F
MSDELVPLSTSARGRYSAAFLAAIEAGLAVRPEHRPQDVAALRARLFALEHEDDATVMRPAAGEATAPTRAAPAPSRPSGPRAPAAELSGPPPPGHCCRPPAPLPAAAAACGPFTALAGLDDIVRHRDPLISVNTLAQKERIVIGKDLMQFRITSSEAGYLYVFFVGTGSEEMQLLLPNAIDRDDRIAADATVNLPRKSWQIGAAGPPGVNHVLVMVSRAPRDFAAAGLSSGETMPRFDSAQARRVWAACRPPRRCWPARRPARAGPDAMPATAPR